MRLITEYDEMSRWHDVAIDDREVPFELVARRGFNHFRASGFSSMFSRRVINPCCLFASEVGEVEIAAFFTKPDPTQLYRDAGYYGGMVFRPDESPSEIASMLFAKQMDSDLLSIYEASQRMFIVPSDRRWLLLGDRDSDLVLFCFRSSDDEEKFFLKELAIETFETLADAARYAKSFMNYDFDLDVFQT